MERSRNWPELQVTDMKNPRYTNCKHLYPYHIVKIWKHSVERCDCGAQSNEIFPRCWVTWPGPVTWPDLTWCWNFHTMCGKDVETGVPKTAALRAAVFLLSPKNLRGCLNTPPSCGFSANQIQSSLRARHSNHGNLGNERYAQGDWLTRCL